MYLYEFKHREPNKLKPWMTSYLTNMINTKNKLHKKIRKHPRNKKFKNYLKSCLYTHLG